MYDSKYKIAQCVENKGEQAEQTYKLTFPAKLKIHDIKRLDKQKLKCPTPTPHLIEYRCPRGGGGEGEHV